MAIERTWERQGPILLTEQGGDDGILTLETVALFKVKQVVVLSSTDQPDLQLEVKRVISPTKLIVGPKANNGNLKLKANVSAYGPGNLATLRAEEQPKNKIPQNDIMQAVYEQEPTVALRMFSVDKIGRPWDVNNPFPVQLSDGSINIGSVNGELEVQLSRQDNNPDAGDVHDSVRIGNQDYEATYTTNDDESKAALDVMMLNKLIDIPHDDIEVTQYTADGDPEVIEVREAGELKRTLTLSYNADGEFQRVQRS